MNTFQHYGEVCRRLIPEGIVLLEHDGALPLSEGESVALFGRGQFEYLKSGTGSGGRVNCPYVTSIGDELARRVSLDREVLEYFRQYVRENPYDGGNGTPPRPAVSLVSPQENLSPSKKQGYLHRARSRCEIHHDSLQQGQRHIHGCLLRPNDLPIKIKGAV